MKSLWNAQGKKQGNIYQSAPLLHQPRFIHRALTNSLWEITHEWRQSGLLWVPRKSLGRGYQEERIGLCQLIFRGRFGDWKSKAKYVGRSFEEGGNLTNIEKKNNRDLRNNVINWFSLTSFKIIHKKIGSAFNYLYLLACVYLNAVTCKDWTTWGSSLWNSW